MIMHPFFVYLLVSTVCLSICYLVYLLLFRHESGFTDLRRFLLISMLISMLIPLAPLRIQNSILHHPKAASESISNMGQSSMQADQDISFDARKAPEMKESRMNVISILWLIYLVAASIFLLGIIFQIIKIFMLYLSSDRRIQDRITIVTSHKIKTPFSFFSWIFMPKETCDQDERDKILAHEKVHAEENHSMDLLLANLISAFMWFNPLAWRMKYSVQQVHEYLADEGALRSGIDRRDYMALLLNQASEAQLIPLHSSFNHSLIKKRLQMITRVSTYRKSRFKILLLIPLAILLTLGVACVNGSKEDRERPSDPETSFAVETEKLNVLYVGVDNPVRIAASGMKQDDLEVSIDNGKIKKEGQKYIVNPEHSGSASLTIESKGKVIGSKLFRVKNVPNPGAYLIAEDNLIESGQVSKNAVSGVRGISVTIPNFMFDVNFTVTSFSLNVKGDREELLIQNSSGGRFTDPQIELIQRLLPGQVLVIDQIRATGPDGLERDIEPLEIKIEG